MPRSRSRDLTTPSPVVYPEKGPRRSSWLARIRARRWLAFASTILTQTAD